MVKGHLGSVRIVVKSSDGTTPTSPTSAGTSMTYDAFGNVVGGNSFTAYAAAFQPFGFAGGLYDSDTRLLRFGARDYDPEVGRWLSPDPRGFGGGDPNLQAYAGNDPVNFKDPTGLDVSTSTAL